MAILKLEYFSEVLSMNRTVNVLYPEASKVENYTGEDIPVLYLLHGMFENENTWLNRSGIDRLIRHTNLAVVMPSTDLGLYTSTKYGMDYFEALANELPRVIQEFFPNLSTKREKTFVAGNTVGGYGAIKFGLATDRFSRVASLSGSLGFDFELVSQFMDQRLAFWRGVFGSVEEYEVSDNNLLNLIRNSDERPEIYIWCGKQDPLAYELTNGFVAALEALNYDVTYELSDVTHGWYYWTQQLDRVLEWLPVDYVREERKI